MQAFHWALVDPEVASKKREQHGKMKHNAEDQVLLWLMKELKNVKPLYFPTIPMKTATNLMDSL